VGEIFVMANQKGGVGKTTSTFNLGVALTDIGQRVLLVDLDPQAGLTYHAGFEPDELEQTIFNCLVRDIPVHDLILTTKYGVELLPANIDLALAEMQLLNAPARERRLTRVMNQVRSRYDFIIIDSMPSLGILTMNALAAADQVIIPVSCEFLSVRGTMALLKLVAKIRGQLNSSLEIAGLLPTMFDTRTKHAKEVISILKEKFKDIYIFPYQVDRSIRFAESAREQMPIFEHKVQVPGALAYRELARDLVKLKLRRSS
jgi:chromosome partitioning protein